MISQLCQTYLIQVNRGCSLLWNTHRGLHGFANDMKPLSAEYKHEIKLCWHVIKFSANISVPRF